MHDSFSFKYAHLEYNSLSGKKCYFFFFCTVFIHWIYLIIRKNVGSGFSSLNSFESDAASSPTFLITWSFFLSFNSKLIYYPPSSTATTTIHPYACSSTNKHLFFSFLNWMYWGGIGAYNYVGFKCKLSETSSVHCLMARSKVSFQPHVSPLCPPSPAPPLSLLLSPHCCVCLWVPYMHILPSKYILVIKFDCKLGTMRD